MTIFGIDFGTLLAGTIFTERIFEIDGIGLLGSRGGAGPRPPGGGGDRAVRRDVLIVCNLIVDVVYSFLDPRVRLA